MHSSSTIVPLLSSPIYCELVIFAIRLSTALEFSSPISPSPSRQSPLSSLSKIRLAFVDKVTSSGHWEEWEVENNTKYFGKQSRWLYCSLLMEWWVYIHLDFNNPMSIIVGGLLQRNILNIITYSYHVIGYNLVAGDQIVTRSRRSWHGRKEIEKRGKNLGYHCNIR